MLEIIDDLVRETQPQRPSSHPATAQSRLDRDLGFDSLARAELVLRLERDFAVTLPESALAADTPADLVPLLLDAPGEMRPAADSRQLLTNTPPVTGEPTGAGTLNAALDWHLAYQPTRPHLLIYGDSDTPETLSYADLDEQAQRVAAALAQRGVRHGDRVALMLPTGQDYFVAFIAILRAGGVPVPIYPPARPAQLEEHLRRHGRILSNAGAECLITVAQARRVARLLRAEAPQLSAIVTVAELSATVMADPGLGMLRQTPNAASLALLQYTSGSTGDPKGVMLSHAQLMANIRAMGERGRVTPQDVFVSWLPLYHDMGLIGAWLSSLYYGIPLVVMSPLAFLSHPLRWLELIDRHRGTLSGGPNFGFELCLRALTPERGQGLDLSCWRVAFNGAEPVSPRTMERFAERLAPCGLRREALMPVYGLAEAAVGLCIAPPGRGLRLDHIDHDTFAATQVARPARSRASAQVVVNCGPPLPGYRLRIVDPEGRELPERHVGEIEFRGPSATAGYFHRSEATAALFHGDWLRTGDRGYLADGDLHISGRIKDMLVRGGRNIYPYDLEEAIGALDGVRQGCVAVFGDPDPQTGSEALVVVAETRVTDAAQRERITRAIGETTQALLDLPADVIRLVPPHSVLKTSSGKIRRAATAERYRNGRLEQSAAPVWRQALALAARAGVMRSRRWLQHVGRWLYGAYAWSLFAVALVAVGLVALPLPRLAWRWRVTRYIARTVARLAGLRIHARGLSHLPRESPCVLVANHASYLDALVLIAVMPRGFRYLAKAEFKGQAPVHFLLRRMGALFVERFDPRQATRDTQQVFAALAAGDSLAFFPEGTFSRQPGLKAFHMGAFVAAAQAGAPVLPVALSGTRPLLRGSEWLPRPGRVNVSVGSPLYPRAEGWAEAVRLRDDTRAFIASACGEPDLLAP
nr:AMP-binding protein [Halomonas campisalis]